MTGIAPTAAPWLVAARRIKSRLHELGLGTVMLDQDGRIYVLAGAEVREVGIYDDQASPADIAADLEFCSTDRPARRIHNQPARKA